MADCVDEQSSRWWRLLRGVTALSVVALAAVYAVYRQQPPEPLPADAPPEAFSAARAIGHIHNVCFVPHPAASEANDKVRDYIVNTLRAMGLEPEIQATTIVRSEVETPTKPGVVVGDVQNVMVRIRGTAPTKALMLCAHYDSTQWGPGAADDLSGCATLLETLRALEASPPLENDVIFLFTDAEECGLLGAYAFVKEHPWFKDAGLAINFEARGVGGASYMFHTGPDNGWLIPHFLEGASHPMGSSMMKDIYLRMPTTSDYKVFKKYGLQGLDIAFIDGIYYYHTINDTNFHLSLGSLQQHGYYALDLTRYFGNLPLEAPRKRDAVYFNTLGYWTVHYSSLWVIPLSLASLAAFAAVTAMGIRRKRLTWVGLGKGAAGFGFCVVAAPSCAAALVLLAWVFRHEYMLYFNTAYFASVCALTCCIVWAIYVGLRRLASVEDLAMAALGWWLVPMAISTVWFPGASYYFHWPFLFALGGTAYRLFAPPARREGWAGFSILLASCVPGILLSVSTVYSLNQGITAVLSPLTCIAVVLLLGILSPVLALIGAPNEWRLSAVSGALAAVLYMAAFLSHAFNADQPQFASLSYGLDADTGQAFWLSGPEKLGEWERQFFVDDPRQAPLSEFLPGDPRSYWKAHASVLPIELPDLRVISNTNDATTRTVRIEISAPKRARKLRLYLDPLAEVVKASVNGKPYSSGQGWWLNYAAFRGPASMIELTLKPSDNPLTMTIIEQFPSLPLDQPFARINLPSYMVPEPNTVDWHRELRGNTTFVRKSFVIDPPSH